MDTELEINFPGYFTVDISYIEKYREYEELKLRQYLGEPVDKRMIDAFGHLVNFLKPKVFNPYDPECVLIENDNRNEDLINSIEENGLSVKDATVFEFYNKIRFLEKRAQKIKEKRK